jgi:cobalt-zinc-cadmium efflux system outer membrane protein
MMRRVPVALACLACTLAAHAGAPPAPMTLNDLLARFRSSSPAMAAVRSHYSGVQANEVTAALRPNPVFTSANEDFNVFNPARFDIANSQEFTDNMAFLVERGGKRRARIQSARWGTTLAGYGVNDAERQLEFQLKLAFVNLLAAKAALAVAQGNLGDYAKTVEADQLRLQSGDISETEFDRIKVEEARFQSDLMNAELARAQARMQLEALLAMPDSPAFDVAGTLAPPSLNLTCDQLRDRALMTRPDYLAARYGVRKAEADLRLAQANGATDVQLAPEYKRNGPDNTLGLTLQVPLRIFDRNQGEKLRTSYELEASRFAETAARIQTLSDVSQACAAYSSALQRAQLYNSDYLARAQKVRERTTFSFQHGATNLLDYLDAVRSYRDVELAAITANAQVWTAIHGLSFATGTEVLP